MSECLFCRIVAGSIPARRVHEDADCIAFADIEPKAPLHLLIVPKEHFASAAQVDGDRERLCGHLVRVAGDLAKAHGHGENGFRLVFNTGPAAGQTVAHAHLHLLAGRDLGGMG